MLLEQGQLVAHHRDPRGHSNMRAGLLDHLGKAEQHGTVAARMLPDLIEGKPGEISVGGT
jgi:hypothetical protein